MFKDTTNMNATTGADPGGGGGVMVAKKVEILGSENSTGLLIGTRTHTQSFYVPMTCKCKIFKILF